MPEEYFSPYDLNAWARFYHKQDEENKQREDAHFQNQLRIAHEQRHGVEAAEREFPEYYWNR